VRKPTLLVCLAVAALTWPVAGLADHIVTAGTVDARLTERRGVDYWTVEIRWTGACQGAATGAVAFDGDITMIDTATNERIYVGGVVDTSGNRSVSGTKEWAVLSIERERVLFPELKLNCYEQFPLHGGREVTVTGTSVVVPPRFRGGGPGGAEGDYGAGDPTAPPGAGGCVRALVGTSSADTLTGTDRGDVVFGLGGADRIGGRGGHDCLIGGSGNDVLRGELGSDRLTGGRGDDTLFGGPGVNHYDAGPGKDVVDARNGQRELVRCGSGRDQARVDRSDRVVGCEVVSRPS
jgi:Ca2+-binding RTX toxin-like protein